MSRIGPTMSFSLVIQILLAVLGVGLVIGIVVTLLRLVMNRARLHGADVAASSNTATWWGSVSGLFTVLWVSQRQSAQAEAAPESEVEGQGQGKPDLPRRAVVTTPYTQRRGDSLLPRDTQQIALDGRHWWTGRQWASTNNFVPPSAPRSVDGSHWWDGERWHWVPNEFPQTGQALPQRTVSHPKSKTTAQSWLIRRTSGRFR